MRRTAVALLVMVATVASADSPKTDWPAPANISGIASIPPTGSNLGCDATLGICPDPRSTLLLDTRVFFAVARGGVRDDDGSMWTSSTANDEYDFVNDSTAVASSRSSDFLWNASADSLLCRDNVSFAVCSSGATCVSNIEGTSDPLPVVFCDSTTGICEGLGGTSYSGCNSATDRITYAGGPSTTNAGTVQLAMPDGVHPGSQLSKLLAQSILAGTLEFFEYPVSDSTNLIANGHATSNATGWTEVGSGTVAADAAEAVPADFQNGNWYNGGVQLTGRLANTDALLTPTMTTQAGRWYVAKGYARLNSVGAEDIVVQPIDASAGTALSTYQVYQVMGSKYEALTAGTSSRDRQCYGACYFIVKFLASDVDTQISISSNAGTGNVFADQWVAMPAPTERPGLTPIFPNGGGVAVRVEGDSRSNEGNDFADAIDDAIAAAVPRAGLTLLDEIFTENTKAIAGRSADDIVTDEVFSSITLETVGGRYVIVFLGVNDVGQGTPASVASDWNAIADKIRQRGGRPIIVLEPPYRGNTTLTSCEAGTENCTTTIDELADLMLNSSTGVLHQ